MTVRSGAFLTAALAAIIVALSIPATAAFAGDGQTTEDVLHMEDGRVLHGNILSETAKTIVFELIDRRLNLHSTLAIMRADIALIERDLAIRLPSNRDKRTTAKRPASSQPDRSGGPRFGRVKTDDISLDVPTVYLLPMSGQLGTDIHPSIYKKIIDDIRATDPDVLLIEMNCKDVDDLMIPLNKSTEQGIFMHHEYRELVDLFRDDLREYRQVMWVEDSVGFSSLVAMAWDNLYMKPNARLGGLRLVSMRAKGWSDPDVAAKMMAAWTGIGRGFLENGGYDKALADAMMRPEYMLSASFKGREVVWSLHDGGEFIVDADDEETVGFRAKAAEDLLVSDGTADTLDDLAFLVGHREYRIVGEKGAAMIEDYKDAWRRSYENTKELYADYDQHRSWASGDEQLKWLGRAKSDLDNIIKAMKRYEAVEIRWRTDYGIERLALEIEVEKLREIITSLRKNRTGGGRRGGGFGVGGGG